MIILGDSSVGKSSILNIFSGNSFVPNHEPTPGIDFIKANHTLRDGTKQTLLFWDTAGQERFITLTKTFYKKAYGIALVYDITQQETFKRIEWWIENIKEHAKYQVPIVLLGNKVDLNEGRQVQAQQGQQLAEKFGLLFFEISAMRGIGIPESRDALVQLAYNYKNGINIQEDLVMSMIEEKENSKTTFSLGSRRNTVEVSRNRNLEYSKREGKCCK